MVKFAAIAAFVLFGTALVAHSTAQSATGMSAMQYYVGTWSCTGGTPGKRPGHATITFTMDNGMLREWIVVPVQAGQRMPFDQADLLTYDGKHGRYVDSEMATDGSWSVSFVTLSGNTETSIDHVTSSGRLGRGITDRVNSHMFTFTGYPTLSSTRADFRGSCHQ